MEIVVFAKKGTTKDGRTFYRYIGRLTRKSTGEVVTVAVKFRADCGAPDPHACPRVISFDKSAANYNEKTIERDDGSSVLSREMWISAWTDKGEFVDTSMDDFV